MSVSHKLGLRGRLFDYATLKSYKPRGKWQHRIDREGGYGSGGRFAQARALNRGCICRIIVPLGRIFTANNPKKKLKPV